MRYGQIVKAIDVDAYDGVVFKEQGKNEYYGINSNDLIDIDWDMEEELGYFDHFIDYQGKKIIALQSGKYACDLEAYKSLQEVLVNEF